MDVAPYETADAAGYPTVRQISVFLENQVGQLVRLAKLFEQTDIHILALSVVNAVDCAVIRLLVDDPDSASELLRNNKFAINESEVIVVSLPHGKRGLLDVYSALTSAEVDVRYTYPLLVRPNDRAAVVIQAENLELAARTLRSHRIAVIDQNDLQSNL